MNDPLSRSGNELYDAIVDLMPNEEFTGDYPAEALLVVATALRATVCRDLTAVVDDERDELMPTEPNWFSDSGFQMTVNIGQYRRLIEEAVSVAVLAKTSHGSSAWHVLEGMGRQVVHLAVTAVNPDWAVTRARIAISAATDMTAFAHRRSCRINQPDPGLELALLGLDSPTEPANRIVNETLSGALAMIDVARRATVDSLPPRDLDPRFTGYPEPDETSELLWQTTIELLLVATELLELVMRKHCPVDPTWDGTYSGLFAAVNDITAELHRYDAA
ncbi:hypothetical protein [Rhodococcus kronopolitis]|uniref:Uncharacterized protein n=1 Tax=Rhodococcus kronopolitis TaxID=1460226 RepID=A0ABV9FXA3_9NOCA